MGERVKGRVLSGGGINWDAASMHLANLIESESSKSSALTLLEECSKINPEVCEENLATLNLFLNFTDK